MPKGEERRAPTFKEWKAQADKDTSARIARLFDAIFEVLGDDNTPAEFYGDLASFVQDQAASLNVGPTSTPDALKLTLDTMRERLDAQEARAAY